MTINSRFLAILILVSIFGGISLTSAFNLWHTKGSGVPTTIRTGEFAGMYNPEDIRGSSRFADTSRYFNIPIEDLAQAFGVTVAEPGLFQNKDLEGMYHYLEAEGKEIGNGSVKYFVALYTGLPFTNDEDEDMYLPLPAIEILDKRGKITAAQKEELLKFAVDISNIPEEAEPDGGQESIHNDASPLIKGNTIFKEVLDMGLTQEEISVILGREMPHYLVSVKDFCFENNISFGQVKQEIEDRLSRKNN